MEIEEWAEEFKKLSDEQLVERWQGDLGKPGWVRSRGNFLVALRAELAQRGIGASQIKK